MGRGRQIDWLAVGKGSAAHAFLDGRYWIAMCRMGPAENRRPTRRCLRCVRALRGESDG